jgi:hypothetical protein
MAAAAFLNKNTSQKHTKVKYRKELSFSKPKLTNIACTK